MKGPVVIKFGGSNLRAPEDMHRLVRVLRSYSDPVIIVISALYGITDRLLQGIAKVGEDADEARRTGEDLQNRYGEMIASLLSSSKERERAEKKMKNQVEELVKYLNGIHLFGEIPDFIRDRILSLGERFSSMMLSSLLREQGMTGEEMLPEALPLLTDGHLGEASVDFSRCEDQVARSLISRSRKGPVVIPGFYGVSSRGRVTLFGRGGSDYSAACIARCVGACRLDIYKDVPGFMTVDPNMFPEAGSIPRLSYREAAELSYFGAKILHPRTFEPLEDQGIPLQLFNILDWKSSSLLSPSTVISNGGVITPDLVKSVTYSDDFSILKLKGPRVGIHPGIMASVTTTLSQASINIKSIITAQTCINILLGQKDVERGYQMLQRSSIEAVDHLEVEGDISLIAVVGEGMLQKPGVAARVFRAVSSKGINVGIISAGGSPVVVYFIVHQKDRSSAVHSIHKEFFHENH